MLRAAVTPRGRSILGSLALALLGPASSIRTAAAAPSPGAASYVTTFDTTELPISERGAWTNNGLDWTGVRAARGMAFGTQSFDSPNADDSIAVLSGFPADQSVSAVIHLDPSLAGNTHEVELLLRFAISAHSATGYECNLSFDGAYSQIVSWNGPLNEFTMLSDSEPRPGLQVREGSVFSAKIVANVITVFLDGVPINGYTDSAAAGSARWSHGNPGIGFWHGDDDGLYGFTSFAASSVPAPASAPIGVAWRIALALALLSLGPLALGARRRRLGAGSRPGLGSPRRSLTR